MKKGLLKRVFKLFMDNPKKIGYMLLTDIGFIASFLVLGMLFGGVFPEDVNAYVLASSFNAFIGFSTSLVYFIVMLAIYSLAKNYILKNIKSMFEKTKIDTKNTFQLFIINLVIAAVLAVLFFALIYISTISARPQAVVALSLILLVLYLFFSISFAQSAHSIFLYEDKAKDILKKAMNFSFLKIRKYWMIYVYDLGLMLIAGIVLTLLSFLLRFLIPQPYYLQLFNIISLIVILLIGTFNRICFFIVVNKK